MIHTFAAIYIGSYEVSIKIFEISGKKKIRDIDYIRSRIEHGRLPGGQLRSICCRSLEKR